MEYKVKNVEPTTIVILGNGFDLKCGLHSSFQQFYENEIKGKKENTNIWYLIFKFVYYSSFPNHLFPQIFKPDIKWMDIESLIRDVAIEKKFAENEVFVSFVSLSYIKILIMAYNNRNNVNYFYNNPEMIMLREYFKHEAAQKTNLGDKNNMYKFLYEELLRFEKDFSLYISKEVEREGYVKKVENLLLKLLEGEEFFYLLNFNYTTYSFQDIADFVSYESINNVHGSANNVEGGIIIGFDTSNFVPNEDNNNSLLLSKVYQRISLNIKSPVLPKTINKIKFYGHSLGEQDYSYFHTLFDTYDISGAKVSLEFYYSKHGNTEEEIVNNESHYRLRVINLIEDYSSRKGSQVKNLASKLNFHNKLFTKEIDF